jgi:hypothetical protein
LRGRRKTKVSLISPFKAVTLHRIENAVTVAPLAMSLWLSLSLGWRNAVLLGVAFGGMSFQSFDKLPLCGQIDSAAGRALRMG